MMKNGKKVTIAIPCFNENENVEPMAELLSQIMNEMNYDYEILFTDNCSTDGTKEKLKEMSLKDKHIKVIINNRNYGVDGRSERNTFKYVSGDVLICLPCDFQEPPELIPDFIRYWEEGYKVVCGQKTGSKENGLKYFGRHIFYKIIKKMSDIPQYEHISGIVLMDKMVLDEYIKSDYDFSFRFALADMGYDVKLVQYEQQRRRSGKSSYNLKRLLSYAINSMTITSTVPIRMMTVLGGIMSFVFFVITIILFIFTFINNINYEKVLLLVMSCCLFIGALIIFALGIVGEYICVILRKITNKPDVILSKTYNLENKDLVNKL